MARADAPTLRTRLRWKARGNTAAIVFPLVLIAETAILSRLPFAGEGIDEVGAFLVAGFFNLAMVGFVGPVGSWWLRRRRKDLPPFVARDRAGTAAMLALLVVLLVAGIAHQPFVADAQDDRRAQAQAVRDFVAVQAPELASYVDAGDTSKLGDDLFRTCVPTGDAGKALCLFVATDQSPPGVTRDPDMRPNSVVSGPDNPGRRGG